jgi:hypothetical protein
MELDDIFPGGVLFAGSLKKEGRFAWGDRHFEVLVNGRLRRWKDSTKRESRREVYLGEQSEVIITDYGMGLASMLVAPSRTLGFILIACNKEGDAAFEYKLIAPDKESLGNFIVAINYSRAGHLRNNRKTVTDLRVRKESNPYKLLRTMVEYKDANERYKNSSLAEDIAVASMMARSDSDGALPLGFNRQTMEELRDV